MRNPPTRRARRPTRSDPRLRGGKAAAVGEPARAERTVGSPGTAPRPVIVTSRRSATGTTGMDMAPVVTATAIVTVSKVGHRRTGGAGRRRDGDRRHVSKAGHRHGARCPSSSRRRSSRLEGRPPGWWAWSALGRTGRPSAGATRSRFRAIVVGDCGARRSDGRGGHPGPGFGRHADGSRGPRMASHRPDRGSRAAAGRASEGIEIKLGRLQKELDDLRRQIKTK